MGGKILSQEDMDKSSGSRWDPKASVFAPNWRKWYTPLLPVFRDLNAAVVSLPIDMMYVRSLILSNRKSMGSNFQKQVSVGSSTTAPLDPRMV